MSGEFGDPRLPERFWAKVEQAETGCWLWTGSSIRLGYGMFHLDGKMRMAHRVAFAALAADLPPSLDIDHMCRVPACVNPAHLQAVTTKQNMEHRGASRGSKSGVQGVSWRAERGTWKVRVIHFGRTYHGGHFHTLPEAEAAAIALRNSLFTNNLLDRGAA